MDRPWGNATIKTQWSKIFDLSPKQQRFIFGTRRRFRLFCGGIGSGKTWALCVLVLYLAMMNPGCPGLFAGRTGRDIQQTLLPTLFEVLDIFYERTGVQLFKDFNKSEMYIELTNGSIIWLRPYNRYDKLRGLSMVWACLDEIEYCEGDPMKAFSLVNGRIRKPSVKAKLKCLAVATTPNGLQGVVGLFFRMQREESERAALYFSVRATIFDNPTLDPADVAAVKAACSARQWKQEGLGLILKNVAVVFEEFEDERHLIDWRWQEGLPWVLSIDWGQNHAYHNAAQVLPDGRWIYAREEKLEGPEAGYMNHRAALRRFVDQMPSRPSHIAADRAVPDQNDWVIREYGSTSTFAVCESKLEQLVAPGIEMMRWALDPMDVKPSEFTGGTPYIYLSRELDLDPAKEDHLGLYQAFLGYKHCRNRMGIITDKIDKDDKTDHPIDASRYGYVTTAMMPQFHGGVEHPYWGVGNRDFDGQEVSFPEAA